MTSLLVGVYSLFAGFVFLFVSALLLYHRHVQRWMTFTLTFAVVYPLGSYVFFGRTPNAVAALMLWSHQALPSLLLFLLVFGFLALLGYGLFQHWCYLQHVGAFGIFVATLASIAFFDGLIKLPSIDVESVALALPWLVFFVGTPAVCGYALMDAECGFWRGIGIYGVFIAADAALAITVSNLSDKPFWYSLATYQLTPATHFCIEIGTVGVGILGTLLLIGRGIHWIECEHPVRETISSLVIFWSVMLAAVVIVQLTIGFHFIPALFSGGNN